MKLAVLVPLVPLFLAGCAAVGQPSAGDQPGAGSASINSSDHEPTGDPIHDRWNARTPFPSCGAVTLGQLDQLEKVGRQQLDCIRDALASGVGAELTVTFPTVEGDPIIEHYRLTPGAVLQTYVDSTADTFGAQEWSYVECADPDSVPDPGC